MGKDIRRPQIEALEGKTLLNAAGVAGPSAATVLVAPPVNRHHIALNGEVSGSWSIQPGTPDSGETQTLKGSGTIQPLGTVQAQGTLHSTGFIAKGHATGTLILSNVQGSVTLQLTGPPQSGFSAFPGQYTYKIVAGTGKYKCATDQGTAMLFEAVVDPPVSTSGNANTGIIVGPFFRMTLHSTGTATG
jgi:hypothetical protein